MLKRKSRVNNTENSERMRARTRFVSLTITWPYPCVLALFIYNEYAKLSDTESGYNSTWAHCFQARIEHRSSSLSSLSSHRMALLAHSVTFSVRVGVLAWAWCRMLENALYAIARAFFECWISSQCRHIKCITSFCLRIYVPYWCSFFFASFGRRRFSFQCYYFICLFVCLPASPCRCCRR